MCKQLTTITKRARPAALMPALALALFACANDTTPEQEPKDTPVINATTRYETVPLNNSASAGGSYKLVYSAYDDTNYYYLFLLGKVHKVPLAYRPAVEYNGTTPITIRYAKQDGTEESITQAVKTAAAHSVTRSVSLGVGYEVKAGIDTGLYSASLTERVNLELGTSGTQTWSTENTVETTRKITSEIIDELTATLGTRDEPAGLYRYALFGSADVYYVAVTNKQRNALVNAYTAVCAHPQTYWGLDYEPDLGGSFGKTASGDLLTLPQLTLSTLPMPGEKLTGGVLPDPTPPTTTPTPTPSQTTYTVTRSSGTGWNITGITYSSKAETFNPRFSIPALKQAGYKKLEIQISFDYKGDWVLFGVGALRVQLANHNKSAEIGREDFAYKTDWTHKTISKTVSIDATGNDSGQFMLLWSRVEGDGLFSAKLSVGTRTVTVTALK